MISFVLEPSESGEQTTYGIRILKGNETLRFYPSVSEYREDAVRLINRLERNDVSALHYDDVVSDYILELAYNRILKNGIRKA